ncbi:hypothetical protein [Nostoc sp. DedSLP03]|uniref:hypothetical protein n=1 Tax=Nostoc sp. DedSLP03 TaxID=3075400 RepID=UPI002AD2F19A|nr:hypothetical protein [Nostoc sp. DedSLP03]
MGKVVARQPKLGLSNNPEQIEESIRFEMYRNAVFYQILHAQAYIEPARYQINLEHSVQVKDLFSIVSNNSFVPSGREHQFAKGLYAGLTGDFFTSTHFLIPAIALANQAIIVTRDHKDFSKVPNLSLQDWTMDGYS